MGSSGKRLAVVNELGLTIGRIKCENRLDGGGRAAEWADGVEEVHALDRLVGLALCLGGSGEKERGGAEIGGDGDGRLVHNEGAWGTVAVRSV